MMRFRRGQSVLEFTILSVIIIAAFVSMQTYMKRGIQGRWKDSVDQLGEQYDPGKMNGLITRSTDTVSTTRLQTIQATNGTASGYYTMRMDTSNSTESKTGSMEIKY